VIPIRERISAVARRLLTATATLYRRDPLIAALFTAAAIATLLPVWIGRYLPLLDYPNHLSNVFVWRHLHDPRWGFAPYYALNLGPMPYYAQYALVYLFSLPFGEEIAQKLFVSLSLLALPASLAVYARRLGRDPRIALLAFPLAWNVNLANGFLSYVAGLPLLFFALAALDRHAERPSWKWGVFATLLGSSLYFFHILPFGLFLLVGGFTAIVAPRPWSPWRAILGGLPTLPAFALALACWRAASTMSGELGRVSAASTFDGVYNDLAGNLTMMPGWIIDLLPGGRDEWFLFALGAAWLLLVAGRARDAEPAGIPRDSDPRSRRGELGGLIVFALYHYLPRSLLRPFYWFAVNRRLAVVVALFALLAVRGRLGRARRAILALAGAVAILYPVDLAAHFHRFNVKAHGFDEVMHAVPFGAKVLPLMMTLGDPEVNVNCFNQWGSYVQLHQGGYLQFTFPHQFPLRYLQRLPSPPWDHPEFFRFAQHGEAWDYFLLHGPYTGDPFAGAHDRVKLLKRSGQWEIWQKIPPAGP
jgi:hypothetical protein